MAWIVLIIAGMGEIFGVMSIKYFTQSKKLLPLLGIMLFFGISFTLLSLAMQSIPMGTAYAIWTGIGTAGSALIGILFFKESAEWKRILFLSSILIGAVGLKLFS